jgi:PKD repeat protein
MKKLTLIFACVISIYYCKAQPSNDSCSGAITLTPASCGTSCIATAGTVFGATPSGQAANCGGTPNDDVWYVFVATSTSEIITVTDSIGMDAVFEVFSTNPCGGAGTSISCVNTGGLGGTETTALAGLTVGATYWVRVYDFTGSPTTYTFTICIAEPSNSSTFSYSSNVYCNSGTNPSPTITGIAGGTFTSSPLGLVLNTLTGQIDVALSTSGTYTITYTSPGPCASSSTFNVSITSMPVATFNYAGTPYCQMGTNPYPTFTGGGVAGTFSASPPGLVFISTTTGEVDLAASSPGTYTVTNTIAASGSCGAVTATNTITIGAPATASFSYPGTPYCQSGANAVIALAGGSVAGTFTSNAGLVINASTGEVYCSLSAPGTYTVTNTVNNYPCANVTATAVITIVNAPVATFSYIGTPYCQFGANAVPTFSGGSVAGTFTSNAGLAINPSTGVVSCSVSAPGTYTVTNTIAASGGCPMTSATAIITILPTTAVPVITGPSTICGTIDTVYTVAAIPQATNYTWTVPTSMTITSGQGTTAIHVWITAGSMAGYVTCNSSNNCGSSGDDSLAVTVNNGAVNIGPDVTLPCGVTTYTLSTPAVFGATLYVWTVPTGETIASGQGTTQITVSIASTFVSGQNIVTEFGGSCVSNPSDTMYLTVGTQAINFNVMPDSTNAYNYTMFNATYGAGLTYSWDFGDGSAVSTAMSPSHIYASAGTYPVCLTAANGTCSGTVCDTIVVTGVLNSCNALFNVAHDTASGNPNAYIITNLSFGNNLSYTWSFGDTATSTAVHPTHTYANIGPYQLCLTIDDGAGCVQSYCDSLFAVDSLHTHLQPISIVVVGNNPGTTVWVNKLTMDNEITIAPNPFTEQTTITFSAEQKNTVVRITDVLGKEIKTVMVSGARNVIIDKGEMSKGIYFVRIVDEHNNCVNRKIVVE